ncbi:hypothetical protein [Dyella sp. Tek66A03]|uniref:hypothetical protein n=1 Tax=Dyella sp. Tek66A03 TaxID=3458298 RepID=UPI00403E88E8
MSLDIRRGGIGSERPGRISGGWHKALHRADEAKKLADQAVTDSGPWFPKRTDALKVELKS